MSPEPLLQLCCKVIQSGHQAYLLCTSSCQGIQHAWLYLPPDGFRRRSRCSTPRSAEREAQDPEVRLLVSRNLRRLRRWPADTWHLDEMVVWIGAGRCMCGALSTARAGAGPRWLHPGATPGPPSHIARRSLTFHQTVGDRLPGP
jgi:hypothetical protein